ncbi:phenylalanine-tRNA ligase [Gonapodya prolifera JEL478]|uniref:phenylalanine--tRNA ligase n=1 Tax=Gonapodya prolifera (strain JEL478) TaxID=1344416 RepID=A0A139A3T2_GONPJ|nr:phenylalanine-tRNA ligase [Gonapodya prolifera JEL478]|eukprot:KXS11477.1 phenylalanine-tRNA ligase [Gonapodya prolifera JEL478]
MSEELQLLILRTLDTDGEIADTGALLLDGQEVDQLQVLGALNSLGVREMVSHTSLDRERLHLTAEGEQISLHGSHEARVFNVVPSGGTLALANLAGIVGAETAKIGQGQAFKNKWIKKDGAVLKREVESIHDKVREELQKVERGELNEGKEVADLIKRKLVVKKKSTTYHVTKGPNFSTTIQRLATDLTAEMIQSGSWRTAPFKKYNFAAAGLAPEGGALHPLMKVREEFRSIFFELGFQEMPSNHFVESSFWNFDALFQPQQHPARDAHDTFFLKDPASSSSLPEEYLQKVKKVHSEGGYGSIGYQYDWKRDEAEKLILRTHTTSRSTYMLWKLAQEPEFRPVKYFSVDRVFRNETVDATHLAEFHQIEGLIADRGLTLGDLIGFMDQFFKKMGIEKIKFKPAYNPYTEPSMEVFAYHNGLNKWVEIGNSGMFRPEMLRPMGLPEDVRVIAWGLGLERPTMIRYGISNIRDLLGHKCNLDFIRRSGIVRFDKELI